MKIISRKAIELELFAFEISLREEELGHRQVCQAAIGCELSSA
jgi:hypothetical protein